MSAVIWISGLSGAGKSTLAKAIVPLLQAEGHPVISLDGDELRYIFGDSGGRYTREARLQLACSYSRLCKCLAEQGFFVVIATISLYSEIYSFNRQHLPNYFEVYLNTPLEELQRRDSKEIYSHFAAGSLKNVVGLDLNYDLPNPHVFLEFDSKATVLQQAQQVLTVFREKYATSCS